MAYCADYEVTMDANDLMDKVVDKWPEAFEGFNSKEIHCVLTKGKKSKKALILKSVKHPFHVFIDKPYLLEIFDEVWKEMNNKQRHIAVFHVMNAIPSGGFDREDSNYSKLLQPDIKMFSTEYSALHGVPGLCDDSVIVDPGEKENKKSKDIVRNPIKIENIDEDEDENVNENELDEESA